jgi:hypothetical protein
VVRQNGGNANPALVSQLVRERLAERRQDQPALVTQLVQERLSG